MKRIATVLVVLLAFGAAKLKFEQSLDAQYRAEFFRGAKIDLNLREQLGQVGFIAALSGFRAVIADGLYLTAFSAFENMQWGRLVLLFNNITTLQPRMLQYWNEAAWHTGYNAAAAALDDPFQPREALRIKAEREYWRIGRDFLERGIRNNPDHYLLYDSLGTLLRDKFKDHCAAAKAFAKAGECKDAMGYEKRFAAYELAQCPGKEREAYELLLKYYNMGEDQRLPTLLKQLGRLQELLKIPQNQRVYIPPEKHQ